MITVRLVTPSDDLSAIVSEINLATWDDDNELAVHDAESLSAYLACQDTLFLTCHEVESGKSTFLGMASSRIEIKPYEKSRWLYVAEVHVCADQRRKGAGRAMMNRLFEIARERGCEEVWLGTEVDNIPARALYQSLAPDEVAEVIGYSYEIVCGSNTRREP